MKRLIVLLSTLGASLLMANHPAPAPDLASNPAPESGARNPALPTIFIAGDSTAARGSGEDQRGWGLPFADFFNPEKVNVENRARGGRSSRTFITEGLWDELLADLREGDLVLIQFGHNDGGAINREPPGSDRPLRARGSLPGLGDANEAIDNAVTGKHEIVHSFGWYMRKMISEAKAKGARPIVLSLTARNIWDDGRIERGSGMYGHWSYELAKEAGVPFIDLSNRAADQLESMGREAVAELYPQDHTHTNATGAELHAALIVSGLKGLRPNPVEGLLSGKGDAVEADELAWLNLPIPADPRQPTLFLIGDSTVRNGRGDGSNGEWGWGSFLGAHFDKAALNVVNRAVGGLSSRTYLTQGHWDRVAAMMKPGDFVIMQFGHNDGGALNDEHRARGSIRGTGEESEEIVNLLTGEPETVHSYGWYLRQYVERTRQLGATPMIASPVPRKRWENGSIVRPSDSYPQWAERVARAGDVAFIDLYERIAKHYDALGTELVDALFADAHTHTSEAGARLNALVVVEGIQSLGTHPLSDLLDTK